MNKKSINESIEKRVRKDLFTIIEILDASENRDPMYEQLKKRLVETCRWLKTLGLNNDVKTIYIRPKKRVGTNNVNMKVFWSKFPYFQTLNRHGLFLAATGVDRH